MLLMFAVFVSVARCFAAAAAAACCFVRVPTRSLLLASWVFLGGSVGILGKHLHAAPMELGGVFVNFIRLNDRFGSRIQVYNFSPALPQPITRVLTLAIPQQVVNKFRSNNGGSSTPVVTSHMTHSN